MHLETGLHHAPAYTVSGHPFISGSFLADGGQILISFPYVCKNFTIENTGSNSLRVHFDDKSNPLVYGNLHYRTVLPTSSLSIVSKANSVYVSNASGGPSGFEIYAELTNIMPVRMYTLSGSGINT